MTQYPGFHLRRGVQHEDAEETETHEAILLRNPSFVNFVLKVLLLSVPNSKAFGSMIGPWMRIPAMK